MALPSWPDIKAELLTVIHTVWSEITVTSGDKKGVWTSWEAVALNAVEEAKKDGVNAPDLPFVLIEVGKFDPDSEFQPLAGESWRMPISIYYVDRCTEATAHSKLKALRDYLDLPSRTFTNWSVMEYGSVDASGSNAVMAEFASKLRTTLRGGVLRYEPGWEV
jgi:hypothetical protein